MQPANIVEHVNKQNLFFQFLNAIKRILRSPIFYRQTCLCCTRKLIGLRAKPSDCESRSKRSECPISGGKKGSECYDKSNYGSNNSPSLPPNHTVIDTQSAATKKTIPPTHSLIPLWIGRHFATACHCQELDCG